MTNNSYYDDLAIVKKTIERLHSVKDSEEMRYEAFIDASAKCDKFNEIVERNLSTDQVFKRAYEELRKAYLVLENKFNDLDPICKSMSTSRTRVKRLYFVLFDKRSSLAKARAVLDTNILTPDVLLIINRLSKDAKTIGFALDVEELDVLRSIEEYINEV